MGLLKKLKVFCRFPISVALFFLPPLCVNVHMNICCYLLSVGRDVLAEWYLQNSKLTGTVEAVM